MRYTIFGESHGPAIGVVLEGLPSGLKLNLEQISFELGRRAPGKNALSTSRKEPDLPRILSGVFDGKTTGTPLCAVIENTDIRSSDYASLKDVPRPGHADYAAHMRYGGYQDYRGGGHFSGRLTAPLVFAGAVAKQVLKQHGVYVGAHILKLGSGEDCSFCDYEKLDPALFLQLAEMELPAIQNAEKMRESVLESRQNSDSIGGKIECAVVGIPAGIGSPDFGKNVEGIFSSHLFSVPAVKGITFGRGEQCGELSGSEYNDPYFIEDGRVMTRTNCNGGVNGGITNGMPLVFTVFMRPTPSIARPQHSVNLSTMKEEVLTIQGRHDPCVIPRAVPVIEAAAALAACELLEEVSPL